MTTFTPWWLKRLENELKTFFYQAEFMSVAEYFTMGLKELMYFRDSLWWTLEELHSLFYFER